MGLTITTTYAGESAGKYIAAALFSGVTLESNAITIKPNIKTKEIVKKMAIDSLVADATCDFTDAGNVTLTERTLEPKELQVNLELCKSDFTADWEAISMGYSAFDTLPPNFQEYLISEVLKLVAESNESSIWHGVQATSGQFAGFVVLATADADVVDVVGTTVTSSNVIAELGKVVDAIPAKILNTPDLVIWISPNVYRAYTRALGGFGTAGLGAAGINNEGTVGLKPLDFEGVRLFVANGLTANYMMAGQISNFWFGTGLMSDQNEVKVLDMADLDGSKNVRFALRYTAGVQYGIGSEVVLYTPV